MRCGAKRLGIKDGRSTRPSSISRSLATLAALCLLIVIGCGQSTGTPTPTARGNPAGHVATAIAALDLPSLPRLEATAIGEQSSFALRYETPASIEESIAFYRTELRSRGWQEQTDEGYSEQNAGLLVLKKSGILLTISVSNLGAARMVDIHNHGPVDVSALPVFPDAEVLFAQTAQLLYVSPAPLAEVAGFTRDALAQQGWLTYRRPFTGYVEDSSIQTLSLTRGGANLDVLISIAPAQAGKTSVQYVVTLLPAAWPIASDAEELLLDSAQPYVSYTTAMEQGELIALYRSQLAALGWREDAEAATIGAGAAALRFTRGTATTTLELQPAPGGRIAVLLTSPASEQEPALADATAFAPTPLPAAMPTAIGTARIGDLAVPDDAYDTQIKEQTTTTGSLQTFSPASVAAALSFYREALPAGGWQERIIDATVEAHSARLRFVRPGLSLELQLWQMANGNTAITITVEES